MDQTDLALCNLVNQGMTLPEARKHLGIKSAAAVNSGGNPAEAGAGVTVAAGPVAPATPPAAEPTPAPAAAPTTPAKPAWAQNTGDV